MTYTVAYQGVQGSFSSQAARTMFGDQTVAIHTTRFREIFQNVSSGSADFGVVPIENALAGSVHENYDLLAEYDCTIVAECYCPVELHLMAKLRPDGSTPCLMDFTRVASHYKALEQCSRFFEENQHLSQVVHSDTAGAAQMVATSSEIDIAAIASEEAAREFDLTIVARLVQNHTTNLTRFVAISAIPRPIGAETKCSVLFTLPHEAGSLHRLLGEIARAGLNLTKIESRPITGKPFEYKFYADLERTNGGEQPLSEIVQSLSSGTSQLRLLGTYEGRTW